MKRVLFVITDSGTGGAERKLTEILKRLDRKRFEPCAVVVLKEFREVAREWANLPVPVVALQMNFFNILFTVWKLKKIIKQYRPDVVHTLTIHSVLLGRWLKMKRAAFRLLSAPCLNYRSMPWPARQMIKATRAWDDVVICESRSTRDFLVQTLEHSPEKTIYLPNGIDVEQFVFVEEGRDRQRREWGITANELLVGAIGRLHYQKGFDIFIEALVHLKKLNVPHKAVIVGEGPAQAMLERLARNQGVNILWAGLKRDMKAVLSAFDIYVQSSRYEGMSRALMEAMSMGRAIVATAVDGTLDLAQDGENMLLCRPEDALSLSIGLGAYLEKPQLRQKCAENARKSIKEFTTEKMMSRLENAYDHSLS